MLSEQSGDGRFALRLSHNFQSCLQRNEFSVWTNEDCTPTWVSDIWPSTHRVWKSDDLGPCSSEMPICNEKRKSICQDVLPRKWEWNTRKLIFIKAFITAGKPKANNWGKVLEGILACLLSAFQISPFCPDVRQEPCSHESPRSPPALAWGYLDTCSTSCQKAQTGLFISRHTKSSSLSTVDM